MDFLCDGLALPIQDVDRLGFREVALQVPHHLARQVIEQVGVGEVVDVVEVHQRVDDVVLRALFFQADFRRQRKLFVGAQHLADDLALARLQAKLAHVQQERAKAGRDLTLGYNGNARDVDSLLHHDLGGLGYHFGQINHRCRIVRACQQVALHRLQAFCHLRLNDLLHLGREQCATGRH